MQKTIKLLAVLLGAQLLLALGLGLSDSNLYAPTEAGPLIATAKEKVDHLILEGPEQEKVELVKHEGDWLLAQAGDFPADADRVTQLLDRLTGLKAGTPVATSAGAQARFKVDDDRFERRITLARGEETLATLYLGTSPSLRHIHARVSGQEAIHSVELAAYDVPVKTADWENKALLAVPAAEIAALEIAGLNIRRMRDAEKKDDVKEDDAAARTWVADGLESGKQLDPEAVDKLAGVLGSLRFDEVLGREPNPEYGLDKPMLAFELTRTAGEPIEYRLGKTPDKEEYTLRVSVRPEYFRLGASTAKSLIDVARREALTRTTSSDAVPAGEDKAQ